MIGVGSKRNAVSLRKAQPVPKADDLDDIFAPEAAEEHQDRSGPANTGAQSERAMSASPATVRTRLILRRTLLRQARAQRLLRDAAPGPASQSAKPIHQKKRPSPSQSGKIGRKLGRRPNGLQLGIVAAVAGVVCGTALAYVASDYFNGSIGTYDVDAASDETTSQVKPAAATLTEDLGQAHATTQPVALSGADDAPPVDEAGLAPLPVPSASAAEEESTAADEIDLVTAPEESAGAGEEQETSTAPAEAVAADEKQVADEEPSAQAQEPVKIAAVEPDSQTGPARDMLVPGSVESFRDCDLCPVMVKLPAAQFTMGSVDTEEGHQENEGPQRLVTFARPFAIGQFEITVTDWEACTKDGGCKLQIKDEGWGRDKRPAINISWEDITTQYLPWLSSKTGHKYRLPSEAEWEYAARATTTADSLAPRFSFGDDGNALCGFGNGADVTAKEQNGGGAGADCQDGYAMTAPAGSFKPNSFGLFDMHGNVWEWVEDCWNETYDNAPKDGKAWTSGDCTSRVVRGGSWNSDVPKLRSATRGWNQPSGRNRSIGFRVVREL